MDMRLYTVQVRLTWPDGTPWLVTLEIEAVGIPNACSAAIVAICARVQNEAEGVEIVSATPA